MLTDPQRIPDENSTRHKIKPQLAAHEPVQALYVLAITLRSTSPTPRVIHGVRTVITSDKGTRYAY